MAADRLLFEQPNITRDRVNLNNPESKRYPKVCHSIIDNVSTGVLTELTTIGQEAYGNWKFPAIPEEFLRPKQ